MHDRKKATSSILYPLLLENVVKYTKDDNPDKQDIPKAIALIRDFLSRVNTESGKSENHFNLMQLNMALKFAPGDYVDLKLTEENRTMLIKMAFKKGPTDSSEVTAYLFDHAVLLVRIKAVNKREEYRPLAAQPMHHQLPKMLSLSRSDTLGKGGYDQTLWATSQTQRKRFIELVEGQQRKLREHSSNFYSKTVLCEGFFTAVNRVNCLVPIDGGRKLVYGTDNGIYLSERWPKDKSAKPKRVLDATAVTQIDTLEEYQLKLWMCTKHKTRLYAEHKRIQGHVYIFKSGIGLGRHLVCSVKTSALSSTI
ncbi:Rho1 guanine nucleotide exchange factor 1 [Coccidioides immitis RMSCC 3703]|uniref:Rho1 guanine nucleotide exchange factor 1 n=1 Tax=Coccidioides immitis RMSCC 3703 TaxID=454286 RepID=A0A0J8QQV7_COCIT|nr:Rho1 guanine nucleotide exchange factor 1 [Coccidioides immitis RMSCC 3703]